jgi:hypothetical protein
VESWFADAKPVNALEPEIAFHLSEELQAVAYQRPEPLVLPSFSRAERLEVRSAELIGHEAELAAYYRQIVDIARRHGLKLSQVRQYFWLDLRFDNEEAGVRLSFPWYDTFAAMDHVLQALAGTDEGLIYTDMDQGWEFDAWARGGTLYIREGDPDSDAPAFAVTLPRAGLRDRIVALRTRTQTLIGALAKELGADVWTTGEAAGLL